MIERTKLEMAAWIPDLGAAEGPKYLALADALTASIRAGELEPGTRLLPQREMARQLSMDLTTVSRAFKIARQRGLIDGRGKAGSFVRDGASYSIDAAVQVDTGLNTPPVPAGGSIQNAMKKAFGQALDQSAGSLLQYQPAVGDQGICRAGADLAVRLGLSPGSHQIVLTSGGQNALLAVSRTVLSPGDKVACGEFIYPGFRAIASRLGIKLVPLPEMNAAALDHACTENKITALYVVPTNDNPTAATIPVYEREKIAEVALRHNLQIIEDDAYGLLPKRFLPAISSLMPQRSWHILSTSKTISPALRIAFVSAPSVADAIRLRGEVHDIAVMPPPLNAAMVALWLRDGTFDKLLSAVRTEAERRSQLAANILSGYSMGRHPQGYHIWLQLPEGASASYLSQKLAAAGVGAIPSDRFAVRKTDIQALRVSLGGVTPQATVTAALKQLAGHLALNAVQQPDVV